MRGCHDTCSFCTSHCRLLHLHDDLVGSFVVGSHHHFGSPDVFRGSFDISKSEMQLSVKSSSKPETLKKSSPVVSRYSVGGGDIYSTVDLTGVLVASGNPITFAGETGVFGGGGGGVLEI